MKRTHLLVLVGSALLATSCASVIALSEASAINIGGNNDPSDVGGGDNPISKLKVTFDFNGGQYGTETKVTFEDVEPTTYFYYVKQRLTGTVTPPEHYTFNNRYSLTPDGSTGDISDAYIIKQDNLTFYAQYDTSEHQTTVHWMDGADETTDPVLIQDEIYFQGETPSFKGNLPHHEGKAFDHWDPAIVEIGTEEEVTYTAKYVNAGKVHVVTLDYNDGSGAAETHYQTVVDGYTAVEPTITKPGSTLTKWTYSTGAKAGQDFDFATTITEDISIEANWTEDIYHITYVPNGGTLSSSDTEAKYHEAVTSPELNDRPGYDKSLVKWYEKPDFSGSEFVFGVASDIESDITLYAKWGEIKKYTVHFYDNETEYSGLVENDIEYGDRAYRPADPIKDGYTFGGWYITNALSELFDFSAPLTGDDTTVNVYAKFNPIICRVTFNPNGGTISSGVDFVNVNKGDSIPSTEKPTVTSPEDMGEPTWYKDAALTQEFIFDDPSTEGVDEGTKVDSNMTLYAGYEIKAGDSFQNDSWTVFLNEIEGKSFNEIKTSDAYKDDLVNDSFVGLSRKIDVLNEDGTTSQVEATVVHENTTALANQDKFTFLITVENEAKFNSVEDDNLYKNSDICRSVNNFAYRIQTNVLKRMSTVPQICFDSTPGATSTTYTIDTKLFVPSVSQVYGIETPAPEGGQFKLFENEAGRSKIAGSWLRSPRENTAGMAYYATATTQDYDYVTSSYKVCAAFVIK